MAELTTKELLEDEIKAQLENLNNLEPGSKEHAQANDDIAALYKVLIEANKSEASIDNIYGELDIRNREYEAGRNDKVEEIAMAKSESKKTLISKAIEVGVPIVTYVGLFFVGLNFEKTGNVTSQFVRNVINKITPRK